MLKRLKLRWIFRRRKMEAELEEELRYHLELEVARQIECGMDPREARMVALRGFGGFEQKKEECRRDAVATRLIEELWQDLQYGLRMMRNAVDQESAIRNHRNGSADVFAHSDNPNTRGPFGLLPACSAGDEGRSDSCLATRVDIAKMIQPRPLRKFLYEPRKNPHHFSALPTV
jgi:hypothetical protein